MVIFESRELKHKTPFGAVREGETMSISISFSRDCGAYHVRLVIFADDGSGLLVFPMKFTGLTEDIETYSVKATVEKAGLYWYRFEYDSPEGLVKVGCGPKRMATLGYDTSWQVTVFESGYETPSFIKGGIMYQIFPDRFRRSKNYTPIIREDSYLREDWGGVPALERYPDGTVPNNDFFGGNLLGIEEKLDYLRSLGVNLIYLNPIFEAASNHKYDTGDYEKIDGVFGQQESFAHLCQAAEEKGIKIILDGVFNHTGADSKYFNRLGRYDSVGAYQSKDSPYFNWYHFTDWPEEYDSWWGVKILPQVNERNTDYLTYITGQNGILKKWIREGAAGYRLDVADELPDIFLDKLRKAAKEENQEILLIGEVWEDASNKCSYGQRRRYLLGQQLDSVTNYVFKDAIISYALSGNSHGISETVISILENYPKPAIDCLMNVLGTHDTARIGTVLEDLEKMKNAVVLQYFLPGVPCVFYGDEAGLQGQGDPFCRGCFPWGKIHKGLLSFYRKLGKIRLTHKEILAEGVYTELLSEHNVYGFMRSSTTGKLAVFLNMGQEDMRLSSSFLQEKMGDRRDVKYRDILAGRNIGASFLIKAKSAIILSRR